MDKRMTLKKPHEFRLTYRKGQSAAASCIVVYCRRNRLRRNRLGLTASTKIGGAVVRNRARRRMREVYRLHADRLKTGYDFILVARSRTASAPWGELTAAFSRLCRKLGVEADS